MSESGFFSSVKQDFVDIRKDEWPRALGLSVLFFLVIAIFWVLKPMKRGVILSYFGQEETLRLVGYTLSGAQAEQVGKVITMVVAYLMVVLFTLLVRRLRRQYLVVVFCSAFAVLFLFYAARMDNLTAPIVWSFYVSGDIWTTLMVTTFWAFANDINTPGEARRMYGVVGLGGVVGGFVGATTVASLVESVGRPPLLLALVALLAGIVGLTFWVDRRTRRRSEERDEPCCPDEEGGEEETGARPSGSAALEGARLVFRSRYLLGIAGLLGFYELVSNIVDFQLAVVVEREVAGALERDAFFGMVGQITGLASIAAQIFLTTYVLNRFGVRTALMFLPVAVLGGSVGFLVVPSLFFAAFMRVGDNALNYSINQSAREALYTPTSQDAKYKAKAFIDMFVQRAAKVVAVGLNLGLTAVAAVAVRWLSLLSAAAIAGWIVVIRYLGDEFRERADEEG